MDATTMSFDAWQSTSLRPATISIHDHGDVLGQERTGESELLQLLVCVGGFPGQRSCSGCFANGRFERWSSEDRGDTRVVIVTD
jgi:hypothetical protein